MSLKEDLEIKRKKLLGLNEINTNNVYKTIIDYYNKKITEAPRRVLSFSIDIVICNMNYYNRLGKLEELKQTWGDNNFYVDLNNSAFVKLEIDEDGNIDSTDDEIIFKDIDEFKNIDNISFSLTEIIELCKKDNFYIKILASDKEDYETTLEILPFKAFDLNESVRIYLETFEKEEKNITKDC